MQALSTVSSHHLSTSTLATARQLVCLETKLVKSLLLDLAGSQMYGEAKFCPVVPVVIMLKESE